MSLASMAQTSEAKILETINSAAQKMQSMTCDFTQTKSVKLLSDKMVSKGKMSYQQSNKLRWEYTTPYTYTFVLNGSKVTLKKNNRSDVIEHYVQENSGLLSSTILALVEDSARTIVMSTADGLARFYPETKTFFHWLPQEGMLTSGFRENAVERTEDGMLRFGTYDGTISFDEAIRIPRSFQSRLILTDVTAGDSTLKDVIRFKPMHLKYEQRLVAFKISNICFDNPHEFLYTWCFSDGIDNSWSTPSRQRYVRYSLRPGHHTLTVKVLSADDMHVVETKTLDITIDEPWWWSTPARLLYGAAAFLVFFTTLFILRAWNKRRTTIEKLEIMLKSMDKEKRDRQREETRRMVEQEAKTTDGNPEGHKAEDYESPDEEDANEFLLHVNQIITEHIEDNNFTVDTLCQEMGMSRTSFYTKMKSETGFAPLDFIRVCRLEKAKLLLNTSRKNISEIAYDCGFTDPKYFTDVFKRHVGKTPSAYRADALTKKM